jgi:hypothetical protein
VKGFHIKTVHYTKDQKQSLQIHIFGNPKHLQLHGVLCFPSAMVNTLKTDTHLTKEHVNLCGKNCGYPVKEIGLGTGVLWSSFESNLKTTTMSEMSIHTSHLLGIMLP